MAIARHGYTSNISLTNGVVTANFAHDSGSGSDRTLVLLVLWRDFTTGGTAPFVSAATYNGVNLTMRARSQFNSVGDNYYCAEVWTLDNCASGSNTLSVTLSQGNDSGDGCVIVAATYTGANNGVGANVGTGSGVTTTPTVTFTTEAADSLIIGGFVVQNTAAQPMSTTDTPGEVSEFTAPALPSTAAWYGEMYATGGSDTFNATIASGIRWSFAAIELKAAAGAAPEKTRPVRPIRGPVSMHHLSI